MQIKKDFIAESIKKAACHIFLKKGYKKSSLQEIAKKAHVTKSNIYTYFSSKDHLFSELVQPAVDIINKSSKEERINELLEEDGLQGLFDEEISLKNMHDQIEEIYDNIEAFELLLFCAAGSKLDGFRDEIVQSYIHSSELFYEKIKNINGKSNKISPFFIRVWAVFSLSILEEIVLKRPQNDELELFIKQMVSFYMNGIEGVLGNKHNFIQNKHTKSKGIF